MALVKNILLALIRTLILACLGLLIISLLFRVAFGNQEFIKKSLNDSGLYSVLKQGIKQQITTQINTSLSGEGNDANPIIANAINRSVSTNTIRQSAETNISQLFRWLEGEASGFSVTLDTKKIQSDISQSITEGLRERAKTLPPCSKNIRPVTNDIFTINCIPAGVNVDEEITKTQQSFNQQQLISPESNNQNSSTNSVPQSSNLPQYYKIFMMMPVVCITTLLVLLVVGAILSNPRYKILKMVASISLLYAVASLLFVLLMPGIVASRLSTVSLKTEVGDFSPALRNIAQSIFVQINQTITMLGFILLLIGGASLGFYVFFSKKDKSLRSQNNPPDLINKSTPEDNNQLSADQ